MTAWLRRLLHLARLSHEDADLREELEAHRALREAQLRSDGVPAGEAALASRRAIGNVTLAVEDARDIWIVRWLDTLRLDVRNALRMLRKSPIATTTILLTLAVGLGANAATFGMVDRLLLRPFTIRDVDRLVVLSEGQPAALRFSRDTVRPRNFLEWRDQVTSVQRMAAFATLGANLSGGDQPERIDAQSVTADFFRLLGVAPVMGRLVQESDERWGRHQQIVISDALWHRRFGGAADIVGRTVRMDGEPFVIIGVTPAAFDFPTGTAAWVPLAFRPGELDDPAPRQMTVVAERRPGVEMAEVGAEMRAIYERQRAARPETIRQRAVFADTFIEAMTDRGMPAVMTLQQAAAVFVLLIGCANVASLLLARGVERRQELAVRLALGAGRRQLVRQLLIENVVLSLAAVPFALGVTWALTRVFQASMPAALVRFVPGWTQIGVDGRVVMFVVAGALLTSVVFGLLPALTASRGVPARILADGSRSSTAGRGRGRLRRGLVVAEIALALPLLVASGLTAQAAYRFAAGPQGFNPDGAYQYRVALSASQYDDPSARRDFTERLIEESRSVPGVTSAAVTNVLPSSNAGAQRQIVIDGVPENPDSPLTVNYRTISPDYLATLQIPLRSGRAFAATDGEGRQIVSIVSESFVRRYLQSGVPLGRRIRLGRDPAVWTTVVGVSADTIDDWFFSRGEPTLYVPIAQFPNPNMMLVARTAGDPVALREDLRRALGTVDPTQPSFGGMSVREVVRTRTTALRFVAGLMATLGGIALLLAGVGIYGLMAHFVVLRQRELSLRIALGASARDVLRLTIGQGARLTAVGLILGLIGAVAAGRLIEGALFGIITIDWRLVASIAVLLGFVALVATVVPARRALRLEPGLLLKD